MNQLLTKNKAKNIINHSTTAITIIEILIVITIISISLFTISAISLFFLKTIKENDNYQKAILLNEEAIESVRNIRDIDWSQISSKTGNYYPVINGSNWALTAGTQTLNGFTRAINFENVNRDSNDNIISSGGTNDPNTKKITVTVSWNNKNIILSAYLTNFK